MNRSDLELMVGEEENILWKGKPDKRCFILESIFNPMLIFALIWGGVDALVISGLLVSTEESTEVASTPTIGIIFGFAFHLMPVWLYIAGIILSSMKHKHIEYIVTDKSIYISSGVFSFSYQMKTYSELIHIGIHRGMIDQKLGLGDIEMSCSHMTCHNENGVNIDVTNGQGFCICDIPNYQEVFSLIKGLQENSKRG